MDAGKLETFHQLAVTANQLLRHEGQSTQDTLEFLSDLRTFIGGLSPHDKIALSVMKDTKPVFGGIVSTALEVLVREGTKARVGVSPKPGIRDEWTMEVIHLAQSVAKVGFAHGDFIEAYGAKCGALYPKPQEIVAILNAG